MMKYSFHSIAIILAGISFNLPVLAATVIYDDKAAFLEDAGETTIYGFEEHGVTEGDELLSPVPSSQLDDNFEVAYTNLNSFSIIDNPTAPGIVDGTHYVFTHSLAPDFAPDYTFTFSNFGGSSNSITAFGLTITDFASNLTVNDGPVTINYEIGTMTGNLLTVLGGQPDYTQNFVGLIVDDANAFTSITLRLNDNLSGFQSFDEVIYSKTSVPEPSTLLGLLAVGSLGALTRKRE